MGSERTQTKVERARRSQRNGQQQPAAPSNGQSYETTKVEIATIEEILTGLMAPAAAQTSAVLGGSQPHDVRTISSEEVIDKFRQQSGQ